MSEERDSQLSAMFDGELPGGECELLARRLTRDDSLRTQWSRYSLIGAALRAERGVVLHDRVAQRVQAMLAQEATYSEGAALGTAVPGARVETRSGRPAWLRYMAPIAGAGIAASVAAVSIVFMRGNEPASVTLADATPAAQHITLAAEPPAATRVAQTAPRSATGTGEPDRYTTPAPSSQTSIAPPARLANYVVAHSEVSGPLSRRMALLGLVGSDGAGEAVAAPVPDAPAATESADAPR